MRFASLGSGSAGNALLVQVHTTCILVDCGFGLRETLHRLQRAGLSPQQLSAILITHEHGDHFGCTASLSRQFRLPVFMTEGTQRATQSARITRVEPIRSDQDFRIGDIQITPFTVPHDAREPVQFVFSDGRHRLGLLTDAGHVSAHMIGCLSGVDALLLECNHDLEMLANGPYPPALQERVRGPYGHLANPLATQLLLDMDRSRLQYVIGMHLSTRNNQPHLALAALHAGLEDVTTAVSLATQQDGFTWKTLPASLARPG